jgi:hypothetical protein
MREAEAWVGFLERWLDLIPAVGRFQDVNVASDPLDLDHLSLSQDKAD